MDITPTDEQALIAESALGFAREHGAPERVRTLEGDETGFDRSVWTRMAGLGFAGAVFPERYGGAGLGPVELALIVEALGRAALPSPIFANVVEAGMLLLEAGSNVQKERWLPALAAGEAFLAAALAGPSGAVPPAGVDARIAPRGNGFVVDGTMRLVRDAGVADALICLARSGPGPDDLALVLVPKEAAGLHRRRMPAAGGESLWEVALERVEVPGEALVGEPGAARAHVARLARRGAAFKAAELVGIGQAALDLSVGYVRERVQFGRPIGSFQAVHHHCTNMLRDLETTRLLARQAAFALSAGGAARREVAMAKAKASEAIPALTRTAHQIHGAIAYYRDYPLELFYHRALAGQAAYGNGAHHRRALADLLVEDLDCFRGEGRHALPLHHV